MNLSYSRIGNLWSAFSQILNVLILNGHPNESISGRCYRENWSSAESFINKIFFWQSNHCRGAYNNDRDWAEEFSKLPSRIGE